MWPENANSAALYVHLLHTSGKTNTHNLHMREE